MAAHRLLGLLGLLRAGLLRLCLPLWRSSSSRHLPSCGRCSLRLPPPERHPAETPCWLFTSCRACSLACCGTAAAARRLLGRRTGACTAQAGGACAARAGAGASSTSCLAFSPLPAAALRQPLLLRLLP